MKEEILTKAKKTWHDLGKLKRNVISCLLYFLPVRENKIVFMNFNGKGYGCNPKYIADYILDQKLSYELVWLVKDLDKSMPKGIKQVKIKSVASQIELAQAHFVIYNTKNGLDCVKKNGRQYFIQTWHGSYSVKYLEGAAKDLKEKYVAASKKDSALTDYMLSNSTLQTEEYRENFWYTNAILEIGYPRNDILINRSHDDAFRTNLKNEAGVHANKVVLYAPTFRDDGSKDAYKLSIDAVLRELSVKSGDSDWIALIRLHPNVYRGDGCFTYSDKVLNMTNYPDPQNLLLMADVLITDYSSVALDFFLMGRPVFVLATDIEKYDRERGLKKIFYELPYTISRCNENLLEEIRSYEPDEYRKRVHDFMKIYNSFDDGHASQRIVELIESKMSGK